jgi:hypothetical protein
MSTTRFGIIPASLFEHDLGPAEIALIALLSTYADKDGWCWPTQTTLATKLGRSRAWVISCIKKLELAKILQKSAKSHGMYKYRIVYDTNTSCQPANTSRQPADTEQDQELKEAPPSPPKARKATINPDWEPTSDIHKYLKVRYPKLDIDAEAEKMVNWAIDQNKTGVDWNRRFQNWCNTAEKMRIRYGRSNSPSRQSSTEVLDRIRNATQ